jgi:hypothetical protein
LHLRTNCRNAIRVHSIASVASLASRLRQRSIGAASGVRFTSIPRRRASPLCRARRAPPS